MAKVEQDIEVEIDIPKSLKFKKTIGKIKYKLHEEEVKLIVDIKKIAKGIERLQEQLDEANDTLIKSQNMKQPDRNNFVAKYLLKWGVK